MLKHKQIFYHLKRKSMSNIYIDGYEMQDLIDNLNSTELKLYVKLHNAVLENPSVDFFENTNLAKNLNLAVSSVKNAKTSLKQKGYAIIVKFKDENNVPCLRVIVGKDQVQLYNLGINAEITDSKAFNQVIKKYPILCPTIDPKERQDMVNKINEEYKNYYEKK